jgi:class 3 adenylate cyclase
MPELFVHANALDTLLRQRFLTLAIVPWWLYPLLLAPLAWLLDKIPRGWRRGVAFGFSGALPLLTALLFIGNRLFFDPVGPMLGLLLCHALISYWQTARRAQRLRAYVPSHLAESNERQLGPEGERKRVVVLFADVSSFTSWAEAHEPEIIYPLMQECIQILVEETYRAGGTIDKFTGDGIMALFGIPTPNAKDARRAVTAALNMQACLASFNQAHKEELDAPLQIRIGINVGPVVIGSVGSSERRDFTALGDTVNVAARLEQTAEPGTILVSEAILSAIADDFAFEPRGSLALKNRAQPVDTFQILALPKPAGQEAVLS